MLYIRRSRRDVATTVAHRRTCDERHIPRMLLYTSLSLSLTRNYVKTNYRLPLSSPFARRPEMLLHVHSEKRPHFSAIICASGAAAAAAVATMMHRQQSGPFANMHRGLFERRPFVISRANSKRRV